MPSPRRSRPTASRPGAPARCPPHTANSAASSRAPRVSTVVPCGSSGATRPDAHDPLFGRSGGSRPPDRVTRVSRPHARLRLACALSLAAFGALLGAAPAVAAGAPTVQPPASQTSPASASTDALTPLVDCVQDALLGAVASRTV